MPPLTRRLLILNEGVQQGAVNAIDFTGTAVEATVAGALATVVIPPVVLSISAIENSIGRAEGDTAGGYEVTIFGTGFSLGGLTDVEIDGEACTGLVVIDDTEATVVVPAALGIDVSVDVEVIGPGGSDTLVGGWLYWDPSAYAMSCWLRADDVTEAAGAVSSMNDKSGNGRDFVQAGANTPTLVAAVINGHDVVEFDNVDDALTSTGFPASDFVTDTEGQFYGVHRFASYTTNSGSSFLNQTLWADLGQFLGNFARSIPTILGYNWDGSDDKGSVAAPAANTWIATTWQHLAGEVGCRVGFGDYSTMDKVTSGNTGSLASALNLGWSAALQPMNGQVVDLFWMPVVPDALTDGKARSYIATRYF